MFNHWIRGYCLVPPTWKEGIALDRHRMSAVLRMVNSFEDLGFKVDRDSIVIEPSIYGGVWLFFQYRPTGQIMPVHGL